MRILPAICAAALCCSAWPLDIVKAGKPVATIVVEAIPEAAAPRKGKMAHGEEFASEELAVRILQEWIQHMTGAELPVSKTPPASGPAIFIGKTALAAGLKLDDIDSPSHEGLRIRTDGERLLMAGQNGASTAKAVCRFLEELGCRYFMDGPLGKVYPQTKDLSVGNLDICEKPGLIYRNPKGPSWGGNYWKIWNGAGGDAINHAHSWGNYVPEKLFDEHPDFFAMGKDGKRKPSGFLCTSNPELRKYFADRVMQSCKAGGNPSLSPTDGVGYCQCPKCKAQDDPTLIEPSNGTVAVTTRYVDFFRSIGEAALPQCPNSILSFYCYADYTQPPKNAEKLPPNLCAFIAPIRYCRMHPIGHPGCPSRVQQQEMIDGWAKIASKLGYYNYMYDLAEGTMPFFKFDANKKEFPYLKEKGLTGMTLEVLSNWYIYGPNIYMGLRMAYNPGADADALMEDYWQKFYGPAAPQMKAYWMGVNEAVLNVKTHSGSFFGIQQAYTPEVLQKLGDCLKNAAEAAKEDSNVAARVAMAREGFQNAVECREVSQAMIAGDFQKAKSTFDGMIGRIGKVVENGWANREYGTSYLNRFYSKAVLLGALATAAPGRVLSVLPDEWKFAFDEEDAGNDKKYHEEAFDDSKWTSAATYSKTLDAQGLDKTTIQWFRSKFNVPEKHGRLVLYFGEVDGLAEVYVNGRKIDAKNLELEKPAAEKGKEKKKPAPKEHAAEPAKPAQPAPPAAPAEPAAPNAENAPPVAEVPPPAPADAPAVKPPRLGQSKRRQPFCVDVTEAVKPGENVVSVRVDHSKISELFLGGILQPVVLIDKGE